MNFLIWEQNDVYNISSLVSFFFFRDHSWILGDLLLFFNLKGEIMMSPNFGFYSYINYWTRVINYIIEVIEILILPIGSGPPILSLKRHEWGHPFTQLAYFFNLKHFFFFKLNHFLPSNLSLSGKWFHSRSKLNFTSYIYFKYECSDFRK